MNLKFIKMILRQKVVFILVFFLKKLFSKFVYFFFILKILFFEINILFLKKLLIFDLGPCAPLLNYGALGPIYLGANYSWTFLRPLIKWVGAQIYWPPKLTALVAVVCCFHQ